VLVLFQEGAKTAHADAARSHLVLRLGVTCTNRRTGVQSEGCLALVDMAGSEKVDRSSGADDQRIKEGMSVAAAAKALGDCLGAVSAGHTRVPHKDHPLTLLLSDVICSAAKTVLVVNAAATDVEAVEANAALSYAAKCKDQGTGGLAPAVQAQQLNALKKELAKLKKGGAGKKGAGLARPG
jgi:hypothetical protein